MILRINLRVPFIVTMSCLWALSFPRTTSPTIRPVQSAGVIKLEIQQGTIPDLFGHFPPVIKHASCGQSVVSSALIADLTSTSLLGSPAGPPPNCGTVQCPPGTSSFQQNCTPYSRSVATNICNGDCTNYACASTYPQASCCSSCEWNLGSPCRGCFTEGGCAH